MKTWTTRISAILLSAGLAVLANSCMPFNPIGAAGVGDLKVYWVVSNQVQIAALDGSGQKTIHTQIGAGVSLARIAVDKINGKIYWADAGNQGLWWANLDGSDAAIIISGCYILGLAIDALGGKLYVVRQGGVRDLASYDLDGRNPEIVYPQPVGATTVFDLKLDLVNRNIYFTDGIEIYRGPMKAGSNPVPIYPTGATIRGIALDIPNNMIYFTDGGLIRKSVISGALSPQDVTIPRPNGAGDLELDTFTNTLYFSSTIALTEVRKISTSGGADSQVVSAGALPMGDFFLDLWP